VDFLGIRAEPGGGGGWDGRGVRGEGGGELECGLGGGQGAVGVKGTGASAKKNVWGAGFRGQLKKKGGEA